MYILSLEGEWLAHPFWRTRFLLNEPGDLKALRESGVAGVWIDTDKGLDVAVPEPEPPERASPPPAAEHPPAQCSAAEEMHRATR
ncbi:DUF3391 domain-containing protein, partial [Acidihalobacter prosperus]